MTSIKLNELNILLVEPSVTQHRFIAKHLTALKIQHIDWVRTAADALNSMNQFAPDLVISAMHLPDITGADLVTSMRDSDTLSEIPFMLISSETDIRYLEPIRQAGVIAMLPKPYEFPHLRKALYAAIDFLEPQLSGLGEIPTDECLTLIVDDSRASRNYIKRILLNLGFEKFTEAENGREAIDLLRHHLFDLIVTDYHMPEMDGQQLVEYIRHHSAQASIPIMMITSERDESRIAAVQQCGVSAICDKPFDAESVKRHLRYMFSKDT